MLHTVTQSSICPWIPVKNNSRTWLLPSAFPPSRGSPSCAQWLEVLLYMIRSVFTDPRPHQTSSMLPHFCGRCTHPDTIFSLIKSADLFLSQSPDGRETISMCNSRERKQVFVHTGPHISILLYTCSLKYCVHKPENTIIPFFLFYVTVKTFICRLTGKKWHMLVPFEKFLKVQFIAEASDLQLDLSDQLPVLPADITATSCQMVHFLLKEIANDSWRRCKYSVVAWSSLYNSLQSHQGRY